MSLECSSVTVRIGMNLDVYNKRYSMKVDFSKVMIQHTFEGDMVAIDLRRPLANSIHQTTGDIGFDEFAKALYFSDGEIDVPEEYVEQIKLVVKKTFLASIQRAVNDLLDGVNK